MPITTTNASTPEHTNQTVSESESDTALEQDPPRSSAPTPTPPADSDGRTAAENKLWAALLDNPLNTAEELAAAAGIGRSTAKKVLARWAGDSTVTRTTGTTDGARRSPDRWSITEPDTASTTASATSPSTAGTPVNSGDGPIPEQDDAERTPPELSDIDTEAPDGEVEPASDFTTEPDPGDEPESDPGPDLAPTDTDSADSVGVIELGNGIMLIYPMATISAPVSCADNPVCGMVDLLQLLAAISVKPKPGRKAGTKRPSGPREPGMNHSGAPRLAKGALRGMVEDFLSERPGEEFPPNEIAIALGRSSGAVANALDQMENDEVVTMTNEKPRRYTLANSE